MSTPKKRILAVDDEPEVLSLLKKRLESVGYEVLTAANGRQALEIALQETPDLIVLDILMPEMDGYETMKAIREQEEIRSLPIIALTAKAMKGDRQKCIDAGASDYIAKPVDTDHLLSLLRVWLYR